MKTIETTGKIDKEGFLILDNPLKIRKKKVKVIILMHEDIELQEEKLWLKSISTNPAFDFLKDKEEDIYSLNNGRPFND